MSYFYVTDIYRAAIAVDAPAILLNAIDAVGVAGGIIKIHDTDTVVGVDSDMIGVVRRSVEDIPVDACDESGTLGTFLLKVDLARVLAFRVNNERVILLRVTASDERNTEAIGVSTDLHREGDAVAVAQTVEEHVTLACEPESVAALCHSSLTECLTLDGLLLIIFIVYSGHLT